jgi:hypothetical protein
MTFFWQGKFSEPLIWTLVVAKASRTKVVQSALASKGESVSGVLETD